MSEMTKQQAIDARAAIGHVHLTVRDLPRMRRFYQDVMGFREAWDDGARTVFFSADGLYPFHLGLTADPPLHESLMRDPRPSVHEGGPASGRPPRRPVPVRGSPGLYHAAYLLPTRRALAQLFQHLVSRRVAIDGASDHGVSEAIYLRDPEGNGIEIYRDRPRTEWVWQDGQVDMTTQQLDLDGLLAGAEGNDADRHASRTPRDGHAGGDDATAGAEPVERVSRTPLNGSAGGDDATGGDAAAWTGIHPGTRLGHVHLRVSGLERAEAFYHGFLGFDVTERRFEGALFLSAGGYHHHLGANVWGSLGAAPSPPGSAGLRYFTITLPDRHELTRIVTRAVRVGVRIEGAMNHGLYTAVTLRDEDGIGVTLTADLEPGRVSAAGWRSEPLDPDTLLRSA